LPRSSTHETTGMLSRVAMGVWHSGHFEGGRSSDSSEGTRTMTTLTNEPITSP